MTHSESFEWKGAPGLRVDHQLSPEGEFSIWFVGSLLSSQGDVFDSYLDHLRHLEEVARSNEVTHIHCHLERLREVVSRAQHAVYRMLSAMRDQGKSISIHTTDVEPDRAEHQRMATLFVEGVSKQPGATIEVVEARRRDE